MCRSCVPVCRAKSIPAAQHKWGWMFFWPVFHKEIPHRHTVQQSADINTPPSLFVAYPINQDCCIVFTTVAAATHT